jgi:hypothetical protein
MNLTQAFFPKTLTTADRFQRPWYAICVWGNKRYGSYTSIGAIRAREIFHMPAHVLHKLSAYRLEVDAIDNLDFKGFEVFHAATVTIDNQSFDYRLLFFKGQKKTAPWYSAFAHLNPNKTLIPKTLNPGFILLVKLHNSACYAVTGGVGFIHLRKRVLVIRRRPNWS